MADPVDEDPSPEAVEADLPIDHIAHVRLLPDVRGLLFFAVCSCGWRGPNHPGFGEPSMTNSRERAYSDLTQHVAENAA